MLALRLEQGKRGGGEVDRPQKGPTVAWQGRGAGRPPSHEQGVNIREKISQWEGRSQQGSSPDARVKAHPPTVSRSLSGDLLSNGCSNEGSRGGLHAKASISKTKSLGLDFRESPAPAGHGVVGRKSEHLKKCSTEFSATSPGNKPLAAQIFLSPKVEANTANSTGKQTFTANGDQTMDRILDVEVVSKPLPLSTDDQEDNMPAGNFYTSRGFWRKLEGDRLLWEKGRESSGEALPPPKPQRTFQYRAANNNRNSGHTARWDRRSPHNNHSNVGSRRVAHPPSFPPPPCPVAKSDGLSRHKKNRKSFEYEDAARLTVTQGTLGDETRNSGLYHAYSDDNIYEDIVCEVTRDNPYEDVRLSPMCLPIARPQVPKLPPKPQTLQGYAGKVEKKGFQASKSTTLAETPKPATPRRTSTQKTQRMPQYVNKIETIFDDKRGRKRVKNQGVSVREETSGTESDPEDNSKAGSRRSVYIQSTLKRRPGYRTLERDLIQLQQQQLFQIFVVVSLRKGSPGNTYSPEITQQFPKMFEKSSRLSREAEDQLKVIPKFCFPDSQDWKPSAHMPSETFSFVLTGEDGSRWFCYCRKILPSGKGKRLPEVHCIVSKLGCFNLFAKILEEVERRREISPALVYPFMRSVMEAPFPAPGRTVTVKSFLPGSGNEVLTLCRPVDSRLEHVDFDSLLQCLGVGKLLQVFASLLLERRVIFIADKLSVLSRCGHAALALLYPFTWQHTFIPVLPASMLDISCSPTPFLIGVLAPCLPQLLELPIEEVLIVDLCADKFVIQLGDEDCILPSKLQAALQQVLEEREEILRQEDGDSFGGQQADLSSLLSESFVRFFVELVGHYPLHMVESSRGSRELQRDSFRKSHPSRGVRQFLQLFMDTQMFAGFIQDKELRKGGGRGLFEVRVAEYLDSYPEPEPSGVNKFLKGLGNRMKLLQMK
ncbi:DENN domain-containing protein 2C isoform X1 [Seriola dumerili]|uniref:DENN domain-containing protein 2C isoform X1 n=1 Tax=Seriola dumerili TaxID=41447 RepID=UPI000BBE3B6A|nr:DENN domain-containing protein 2C isoform X1 [Seriola dumerili]XP_022613238.1 DENN domain-containing protein 2C isoform X1 [Seriola dumerili]